MSTQRTFSRLCAATTLGLVSLAACAGAAQPANSTPELTGEARTPGDLAPSPEAKRVETEKGDAGAPSSPNAPSSPSAPNAPNAPTSGSGGSPRCPYGELNDPHRGFVRCLSPDERDAGWLPPPPQDPVAPPPDPVKPAPAAPPLVEVSPPKFENGEVPRAEKFLGGATADIAKCIADNGGLTAATGSLKVQFLVRARGRAEGVEVLGAKGISAEAASCVRLLLKNKAVGAPTSDPVGVTVTLTLKAAPK